MANLDFEFLLSQYIKIHGNKSKAKQKALEWFEEESKFPIINLSKDIKKVRVNKPMYQGKIYTFTYDPKTKDKLSYYDRNPIVLSIGQSKTINGLDLGVNLNFLPQKYKIHFLNVIYKQNRRIIQRSFENNQRLARSRKNPNPNKEFPLNCNYDLVKKLLPKELSFALRSYYRNRRKNIVMFGYNSWSPLSLLELHDFVDITVQDIYKLWMAQK